MNLERVKEKLESNRVISNTGCWIWQGCKFNNGYGAMRIEKKTHYIHRLAALIYLNHSLNNELPVLHKPVICHNRACFNPDHIYIGSYSKNNNDSVSDGTHNNARKTHCPQGHEYNENNTRIYRGFRYCRVCYRKEN